MFHGYGDPLNDRLSRRLKQALCNAPLLQYPDPSKPYVVVTDRYRVWQLGDVLMQDQWPGSSPLSIHESSSEAYQTAVLGL